MKKYNKDVDVELVNDAYIVGYTLIYYYMIDLR